MSARLYRSVFLTDSGQTATLFSVRVVEKRRL
jgi:hypothetical protein